MSKHSLVWDLKPAANLPQEAMFRAIKNIEGLVIAKSDSPKENPQLFILKLQEKLNRDALENIKKLEYEAVMSRISAEKAHQEVMKRIEILEIELGIEEEEE